MLSFPKTIEGTARGGGEDFEDTCGELEFQNDEIVKTISVKVIDDEEYEKNKTFFLEIGEPRLVEMSEKKGGFTITGKYLYGKTDFFLMFFIFPQMPLKIKPKPHFM